MPNAYFVSDLHISSPESTIEFPAGAFRSVNLGSWLDAPCYFKLDDTDGRFYELTEKNLPQPGAQTLNRLSAVK